MKKVEGEYRLYDCCRFIAQVDKLVNPPKDSCRLLLTRTIRSVTLSSIRRVLWSTTDVRLEYVT